MPHVCELKFSVVIAYFALLLILLGPSFGAAVAKCQAHDNDCAGSDIIFGSAKCMYLA